MKSVWLSFICVAALWGYGDEVLFWKPHACQTSGKASSHGTHGSRETTMFQAVNLDDNTTAMLIRPDLTYSSLPLDANTLTLPKLPSGGYYALVLNTQKDGNISSAIRYISHMGRPAKVKISPSKLTALSKSNFEIVPDPLHREHDHYTASKSYRFILMFEGHPLPATPLKFETQNGFFGSYTTDENGAVSLTLPNDFKNVRSERNANRPNEFLLTAAYQKGNTRYTTSLSMPYYVNPNDYWQSQKLGAGAVLLGFLGGMMIYRRTQKGAKNG